MLPLLLAVAMAATPSASQAPAVALMPLRSLGVSAGVAKALEDTLRNELAALPEARLLPALAALAPDCDAACATKVAVSAGAERLIFVTASQLGDAFTVDLKVVDAKTGQELRRATRPVNGSRDGVIEVLREAAVELLAPARYVGALQLDVPGAPGALVFIDGKPAGAAPFVQPIDGILPGSHTVRVADAKSREVSTFVDVRFGRTTQARIELGPERMVRAANLDKPWLRPAGYGGVGLGLASLVAGFVYHARAYATASDLNRREAAQQLLPGDQAAFRAVDRDTTRARVFYATGVVLGLTGGAALWWDFRLAAGPDRVGVARRF